MRIAVTLSRIPYPLEKGDKLRAYHQIQTLLDAGHEVHVFCFYFENPIPHIRKELEKAGGQWHWIALSKWAIPLNVIQGLFSDLPWQVLLFHQRDAQKQFNRYIMQIKPDVLYSQMIRTSEYTKHLLSIPKILDYMDALSLGLEKRIQKSPWISRWFWKDEWRRVQKYERVIAHYFDHLTIIAQKDAIAIALPQDKRFEIIPNGIDFRFFENKNLPAITPTVVFTGNMNYPPNVEAALRLGKKIMPLVWKKNTYARLIIAGAEPNRALIQQLTDSRIQITGWMEDIREAYQKGRVFAAPMTMGSGMQNKILEALSMGLPVVCTDTAADAFESHLKNELIVANEDGDIAQAILKILDNPSAHSSQKAKDIIQSQFSWKKATEPLLSLLPSSVQ